MFFVQIVDADADAVDVGGVLRAQNKSPVAVRRNLNIGADAGGRVGGTGVLRQGVVDKVNLLVGVVGASVEIIHRKLAEADSQPIPAAAELIGIQQFVKAVGGRVIVVDGGCHADVAADL